MWLTFALICGRLTYSLYGGFTPQQAIKHFVNLVYEWLAKYVPTKIDKIPSTIQRDYEIYDNRYRKRRLLETRYRWIRWYAEAIVMNAPKEDEIKLKGNTYIKSYLRTWLNTPKIPLNIWTHPTKTKKQLIK